MGLVVGAGRGRTPLDAGKAYPAPTQPLGKVALGAFPRDILGRSRSPARLAGDREGMGVRGVWNPLSPRQSSLNNLQYLSKLALSLFVFFGR